MPNIHWTDQHESSTTASTRSNASDRSYRSRSTAHTDCSEYNHRPALTHQYETCHGRIEAVEKNYPVQVHQYGYDSSSSRAHTIPATEASASTASVNTYASTSDDDDFDDDEELELEHADRYEVPSNSYPSYPTDAVPATPRDFADHFPSSRGITIRHDDSTVDGNMNLRLDTQVESRRGKRMDLTLFHLRMHDLRSREFFLRRYCRDSGREVCHSIRKYQSPPSERPALQRSFSSALAPFRLNKADSRPATSAGLKRSDSGYASIQTFAGGTSTPVAEKRARARKLLPTNTIKLEFSNYAHVNIKRRGAKSSKRYVFEYWDVHYTWRRCVQREHGTEQVSYHLYRDGHDEELAYIIPMNLSPAQRHEELARGGWIPPCHMRLCDDSIINAVPDVSE